MAPAIKSKSFNPRKDITKFIKTYFTLSYAHSLIFDPAKLSIVSIAIIIGELILNILIVQRVKYTEIDWIAYMQECEGFLNGTTNYALLKGKQCVYLCLHNLQNLKIECLGIFRSNFFFSIFYR